MKGNVVVITGASGRLGRHILAAYQEAGATIVTMDRTPLESGAAALSIQLDATSETSVQTAFKKVATELGRIDTLVHTIGTWDGRPILETSLEKWQFMISLNLTSAFLCFKEALRHMHGKSGRLIGIASGQGADRGASKQGPYSASKGGLIRLAESIAAEYQDSGITAHAIAPSTLLFDGDEKGPGVFAKDVASLCVYLSGPAGHALNGATLRAYGE